MAALFSSLVPSPTPFSKHLDQRPYRFTHEFSRYPPIIESPPCSLSHVVLDQNQKHSPVSSTYFALPTTLNNGNGPRPLLPLGASTSDDFQHEGKPAEWAQSVARSMGPWWSSISPQRGDSMKYSPRDNVFSTGATSLPDSNKKAERVRKTLVNLPRRFHRSGFAAPCDGDTMVVGAESRRARSQSRREYEPEPQVTTSFWLKGNIWSFHDDAYPSELARPDKPWSVSPTNLEQLTHSPPRRCQLHKHQQGVSGASSRFVHTVKTASFSDGSIPFYERSLRLGLSSENHGQSDSHARLSVDSDRPATAPSPDEAAICRGIKRRQIIQELIASEESYVGDLRTLISLCLSLLAATCSLTRQSEMMVQRNLRDLLDIHESLVELFRGAALAAANQKWAETISPRKLVLQQHRRRRSIAHEGVPQLVCEQARKRSSSDYSRVCYQESKFRLADPSEAEDVARILKLFLPRLSAYEEYCTRYKIMVREMQRHIPRWSASEAGLEALAKSLGPLRTRKDASRKALTVGDLMVKPIQRVCKYPLLFAELLRNTPCVDCPSAHTEIESALSGLRSIVKDVNRATNNPLAHDQIQRRWLLTEHLVFDRTVLQAAQLRSLGVIELCGVLHVAYQTRQSIDGCYMLCVLIGSYLVLGMPAGSTNKFMVVCAVHLCDLRVDSASDGRGLQCHTALFTWKLSFEADGQLYELILSACSAVEEGQWKSALEGNVTTAEQGLYQPIPSAISPALNLRPCCAVLTQAVSLRRRLSIQRAATTSGRANICQVIVRNTHNPQDLQDFRAPSAGTVNRSQSHLTTHRIVVLAPKRTQRSRLESSLADVWTRNKIPYPGMISSRGGQIIRASAGSLVRRLSLASMHTPFARRSSSLTAASQRSFDNMGETFRHKVEDPDQNPCFEIQKEDTRCGPPPSFAVRPETTSTFSTQATTSAIQSTERLRSVLQSENGASVRHAMQKQPQMLLNVTTALQPDDSAAALYAATVPSDDAVVDLNNKKPPSKPMSSLKDWSLEVMRGLLSRRR